MTEAEQSAVAEAFALLTDVLQHDHGYAWSWHCNLAMSAYDAGCDQWIANQGAARFMQMAFDIDTTVFPEYQDIKERAGG